jgi:hypothetical protein
MLRKLNLCDNRVFFHLDSLKMQNAICPVYRDTQLTNSSFRFLRLIISVWKFRNQTNPDASVNLVFVKHDYFRPLKITAANKAVQFIALAARTILKCMRKSIIEVLSHLLNFRHLDSSCYRDKVNGAAANAPAPMVFATQLRKLYRDKTLSAHLDGKAKTIYATTQSATKLYRRPLGGIARKARDCLH